jgi:hypothetical protein
MERTKQGMGRLVDDLMLIQMELVGTSRELSRLSSSSKNSQVLLSELRQSLRQERIRGLRDKILFTAVAAAIELGVGFLIVR